MTNLLMKLFIKNKNQNEDTQIRAQAGTLSSLTGIVCNLILFVVKLWMGMLANSIAITSDAFNNLSDSASCIVTLFGYKMAAKPADKDHPFGHGRIEYLTSLILASVILVVGVELFRNSIDKVLDPESIHFSWFVLISLIASVGVKLWMSLFNKTLGKKFNSSVMLATSQDSLNDVIATSATIISLIASNFVSWPVDGLMGVVVSIFILVSGIGIIKDTIGELLGQPADPQLVDKIRELMMEKEEILGIHDMIIHSYGPGNMIGSAHAEVNSKADLLITHDAIDEVEKRIAKQLHVMMTIHLDPIVTDDQETKEAKTLIQTILTGIDERLSFHDFRMVTGPTHTNLIFDVLVPFEYKGSFEEIRKAIEEALFLQQENWYTVITFDRSFTATSHG